MKRALTGALVALGLTSAIAEAQEMYVGQIFMMGSGFCPRGSANADGQLLAIAENTTLFSLLGTMYGGDGRTTFALPDLRGRIPMHVGAGPGLADIKQGQKAGRTSLTLTQAQMPAHSHPAAGTQTAMPTPSSQPTPAGNVPALTPTAPAYAPPQGARVDMAPNAVTVVVDSAGGSQPVDIANPYLGIRFCIATFGIYPPRN
jgi:microcystin-dependent protein